MRGPAVIGLIAATENGRRNAAHLAESWNDAHLYEGRPGEALHRAWGECDAIVLFLATGAAVRLVAPLLQDKRTDPGVVAVDDAGRFAVSLCGGHEGGANGLAARVAGPLGATPVVTTASDALGLAALDSLGRDLGLRLEEGSDGAAVGAALVSGKRVSLVSDRRWPLGPLPGNVVHTDEPEPPLIFVSDRTVKVPRPAVVYRPPSLVAGVGCSRGASAGEILGLLRASLVEAGLSERSVAALASIEAKRDETGLLEAVEGLGMAVRFYSAESLSAVETPNPSSVVREAVGTPSVSEAAVLVSGAELVLPKRKSAMATVALGRLPVRGRLMLLSLGPGEEAQDLVRRGPPAAPDPGHERGRPVDNGGTRHVHGPVGDEQERRLGLFCPDDAFWQEPERQPAVGDEVYRPAGDERRPHGGHIRTLFQPQAEILAE